MRLKIKRETMEDCQYQSKDAFMASSSCLVFLVPTEKAQTAVEKAIGYDSEIKVIDELPKKTKFDEENLKERRVMKRISLIALATENDSAEAKKLDQEIRNEILVYLDRKYFEENPRHCFFCDGVSQLGGSHGVCETSIHANGGCRHQKHQIETKHVKILVNN